MPNWYSAFVETMAEASGSDCQGRRTWPTDKVFDGPTAAVAAGGTATLASAHDVTATRSAAIPRGIRIMARG